MIFCNYHQRVESEINRFARDLKKKEGLIFSLQLINNEEGIERSNACHDLSSLIGLHIMSLLPKDEVILTCESDHPNINNYLHQMKSIIETDYSEIYPDSRCSYAW